EGWAAVLEVVGQGAPRRTAEQPDPFLAPLAEDPHLAAAQVEGTEVGCRELADPETGRVGRLDDRPIPKRERHPELRPRRVDEVGGGRGCEVLVDHREEPAHLLDLEDAWQPAWQPRGRDGSPWVAGREPGPRRPTMERSDGGQPLRNGRAGPSLTQLAQVGPKLRPGRCAPVR